MAKKNPQAVLEDPPTAKKHLPLEDPSSATSSDDAEHDEDITDSSSDEEDGQQNPTGSKQQNSSASVAVVSAKKKVPVKNNSGKNQTCSTPVAVSAAKEDSNSGETESETEPPPPLSATAKPKSKRQSEEPSTSLNPKRAKIEAETETKKSYFQRLWSEEDEIVILQGLIDFKSKTGKIHSEDMGRFYDSLKNSISYEAKNLSQFMNKIHSLKKKFMAKEKRGDKLSFAKPHDVKCFQLSKLIWELNVQSAVEKSTVVKSKKKIKNKVESLEDVSYDWFENSCFVGLISGFGIDKETVKNKWSLVPLEMKKTMEEKWKVFVKEKIGLVHEFASLLLRD